MAADAKLEYAAPSTRTAELGSAQTQEVTIGEPELYLWMPGNFGTSSWFNSVQCRLRTVDSIPSP